MAKVTILGDAAVIKSTLKLDDIKNVKKYRPKALALKGGEDGKEDIFVIDTAESDAGSINSFGAVFTRESRDEDKNACITITIPASITDAEKYIVDEFGGALMNLKKMEEILPAVIAEIAADKASIMADIAVAQ